MSRRPRGSVSGSSWEIGRRSCSGKASASLRWRQLPSARSAAQAQATAAAPSRVIGASSYSIFDLSGTWSITDAVQLRLGVDNLLDKDPPVINFNPAVVMGVAALTPMSVAARAATTTRSGVGTIWG
jgi:outer membrane receptor protein involved in Fe transport